MSLSLADYYTFRKKIESEFLLRSKKKYFAKAVNKAEYFYFFYGKLLFPKLYNEMS